MGSSLSVPAAAQPKERAPNGDTPIIRPNRDGLNLYLPPRPRRSTSSLVDGMNQLAGGPSRAERYSGGWLWMPPGRWLHRVHRRWRSSLPSTLVAGGHRPTLWSITSVLTRRPVRLRRVAQRYGIHAVNAMEEAAGTSAPRGLRQRVHVVAAGRSPPCAVIMARELSPTALSARS